MALQQKRILLTEDKDFGRLVYAAGGKSSGVVLLRFPASARREMAERVVRLVGELKQELFGRLVVVQPAHIRIGPRFDQ